MENKALSRTFRLLSQLMELHNENPFKIKSIAAAGFKIDKLPFNVKDKSAAEIDAIEGVGKSISAKITELLTTGTLLELQELLQKTPEGIVEMLEIKGLGPKKISVIWHDLGIENIGELYYACNENRLMEAKGFGLKTQEEISRLIEFKMAASGKFIYAKAAPIANHTFAALAAWLNAFENNPLLGLAGDYRRGCEIIDRLDFVIGATHVSDIINRLPDFEALEIRQNGTHQFMAMSPEGLNIQIFVVEKDQFYYNYFLLTGNEQHTEEVIKRLDTTGFTTEAEIYEKAGMDFIEPELREDSAIIQLALTHKLPTLITLKDLKGSLHNHSTWSDGVNTLKEMALFCRDTLQLEYLGISDHSKAAFYAQGLSEQRVVSQQAEIDLLNVQLAPFKIFKGIECDILGDGSLDYTDDILKTFDFVVASIHSNLKMTEEKAMLRLIKAIENPYTTILGHPTGRLLLSRAGYPIDYKKVIDACAANGVVIEINSNPLRLDLDWRWHRYALEKGVLLSINPDAHRVDGFYDMQYGVMVGRKGGLTAQACLNALSLSEISAFFNRKKS